ncbi:winged helix-turn-helix transcriptional regulator [Priestia megaterium]|uniref:Helix-turn-helix domain-containing protein n=1 Tax=Priestia megaterium TaxID=1404 RepID=A0A3D8WUC4_PRIMG|nr:helix-turn-helix domain-containing protein [Priestia megaterium]MDD9781498.1 helix-turn-helix domain-containing protein [Priestia megaterium]MDH3168889.1 helix-turn-helix domain-containing protein [Priestia megaterium]MED3816266.1 helix-turn-helix domain-containing protein [Priestia megaterium]RDZ05873.1 transcriptional regulator [Priestia megaterium]
MSNKEISQANQNTYEVKSKCPIIYALDIIGQKWKIPIMWHLSDQESIRYNELKRSVPGITNMMLTKSLQELVAHQLVNRVQYDTIPPKVEYSLTEKGKTLLPVLDKLHIWGEEQIKLDKLDYK